MELQQAWVRGPLPPRKNLQVQDGHVVGGGRERESPFAAAVAQLSTSLPPARPPLPVYTPFLSGGGYGVGGAGVSQQLAATPMNIVRGAGDVSRYPRESPAFQFGSSAAGRYMERDAYHAMDKQAAYSRRVAATSAAMFSSPR